MSEPKETLLGCPFCGGEARCYGDRNMYHPEVRMCRVVCTDCEAHSCDHSDRPDAIAAWNRRSAHSPAYLREVARKIETTLQCTGYRKNEREEVIYDALTEAMGGK